MTPNGSSRVDKLIIERLWNRRRGRPRSRCHDPEASGVEAAAYHRPAACSLCECRYPVNAGWTMTGVTEEPTGVTGEPTGVTAKVLRTSTVTVSSSAGAPYWKS